MPGEEKGEEGEGEGRRKRGGCKVKEENGRGTIISGSGNTNPQFHQPSLPPALPSTSPPFHQPSLPPALPSTTPPFHQPSLPPALHSTSPPFHQPSLPPALPSTSPPFHQASLPPALPSTSPPSTQVAQNKLRTNSPEILIQSNYTVAIRTMRTAILTTPGHGKGKGRHHNLQGCHAGVHCTSPGPQVMATPQPRTPGHGNTTACRHSGGEVSQPRTPGHGNTTACRHSGGEVFHAPQPRTPGHGNTTAQDPRS